MEKLRITGPARLAGTLEASGAKNAALPVLTAALLSDDSLHLERVPEVRDIHTMCRLLAHLGIDSERRNDVLELRPSDRGLPPEAPYELVKTMRASVLVLGPLLARHGRARVSLPGGCAIGVRPIDQHLAGLEALGAKVELSHGYVEARCQRLRGARYRFAMPTVGGTENLMMAASLASGTTLLENCAREPEIVNLAELLNAMGGQIKGAGESTMTIEGVDQLHGTRHTVCTDRIQTGTYLIGAVMTRGDVTVAGAEPADLAPLLDLLSEIGATVEVNAHGIRVRHRGPIKARDAATAPHPGFPTDLQAQYMALMTQAEGVSRICETVFENRFQHVPELNRMGAEIHIEGADAIVKGSSRLSGAKVMATDLRASASLVLAGLVAHGDTEVDRIYHLDRGYEAMESNLHALGAQVERLPG